MTIRIRATNPHEYRDAAGVMAIALLNARPTDEAWERSRPSWDEMTSFSAWDDRRCVGHAGQFLVDTTVPGGARVSTGAVSRVGVLPTHRRRGVATGLMEALVRDAVERGLAMMSLRASETGIYRRYGFGVAGDYVGVEIDPRRAQPVVGAVDGTFRLLAVDELLDVVPVLYDRVAHRRPGIITRPASFWSRYLRSALDGSAASFVAIHLATTGDADGYVHYDVKWSDGTLAGSTGAGEVNDLFGATDAVELALWAYLFDLDLVTTWQATERPADDLIRRAAHDPRAYQYRAIEDEQWVRLVDVDTALAARTYGPAIGTVAIGVTDPLIDSNNGTWQIDRSGASRTDGPPDLTVAIDAISAAYLGGTPWWQLAATHRVDVSDPDAIATADALFACGPLPFCGSFF